MTNDLRERVARAIFDADPNGPVTYDDDDENDYPNIASYAIAAMGLPTREEIEAASDAVFLLKLNWLGARLEHGDSGPNTDPLFEKYIAARQRLLDLIPMKEDGDE